MLGPALAQDAPLNIGVRTGEHDTFDRLVFDARAGAAYKVERKGTDVAVVFTAPGKMTTQSGMKLARAVGVRAADETRDGHSVLVVHFQVAANAVLKDFTSGPSVVVDVYGGAAPKGLPPAASPPVAAPVVSRKEPTPPPVAAPAAPVPLAPAKVAPTPPPMMPPAPRAELPVAVAPKAAVPPAAPVLPAPTVMPKPAPSAVPPVSAAPRSAVNPAPLSAAVAPGFGPTKEPEIGVAPDLVAAFDPKIAVGAVIFARGQEGILLFDRKITLDPATLTAASPLKIRLTPLDLPRNNGFRFSLPKGVRVQATRIGTAWRLYFSRLNGDLAITSSFIAQPDFALGGRLLLPLSDPPVPVRWTDPVVGDDLILVPLRSTDTFSQLRQYVDLDVLPAAQGLVIKPLQDKVTVRVVSDGIEVTAEGGLALSPRLDTAPYDNGKTSIHGDQPKSLFDFEAWRGSEKDGFTRTRQDLMQSIIAVAPQDRSLARLQLARLYFAHGYGEEALSILDFVESKEPDLAKYDEFLALRGAAKILAQRPAEGLADLQSDTLAAIPEAALWQAVGEGSLRQWDKAFARFRQTWNLLKTYPEPFFSRFSILAVETALAVGYDDVATSWLNEVDDHPHDARQAGVIAYLRGALASRAGQADQAAAYWRTAAKGSDRLYKIRAELALIDLAVVTRSLTPAQAAERLEGMRFAWRGDDLEEDILHRLGGFYLDAGKIRDGLMVLARAVHLYPNAPMTPQIRAEMTQAYRDLFLSTKDNQGSPLEMLALFREFADLRPTGPEGVVMGQKLAEKLVSIDLLDQAADILADQVKNTLKGEDKVRVGTRLAGILLLDQKAAPALTALDQSQPEADVKVPDSLLLQRTLLRARALSEQKKYDPALALLQALDADPAKMLRADILMHAQRWKEAAAAMLIAVGPPPAAGQKLTGTAAEALLNGAIALSMDGDVTGLDKLAIDYGASMVGTPQADLFGVLTRPEKTMEARDLRGAAARVAEVDLFRSFLDAYRHSESGAGVAPGP